jgi:hypothetical protein
VSHANTDANSYTYSDSNSNTNSDANGNTNTDANSDGYCYSQGCAAAAPDAASSTDSAVKRMAIGESAL